MNLTLICSLHKFEFKFVIIHNLIKRKRKLWSRISSLTNFSRDTSRIPSSAWKCNRRLLTTLSNRITRRSRIIQYELGIEYVYAAIILIIRSEIYVTVVNTRQREIITFKIWCYLKKVNSHKYLNNSKTFFNMVFSRFNLKLIKRSLNSM